MVESGYDTFRSGDDEEAVARLMELAFGGNGREATLAWLERSGHSNLRVIRDEGVPVAAALLIPMGQYFGGRRVPMTGVAGVAVAPEARGRGIGGVIMEALVKEMGETGTPISTLFPATQSLYRRSGYEQAGSRFYHFLDLRLLGMREVGTGVREATERDRDCHVDLWDRFASAHNGQLARGDYIWNRVFGSRDDDRGVTGFVSPSLRRDGLDGALFYKQIPGPKPVHGPGQLARVDEFIATNADAARSLLGVLAGLGTVVSEARVAGGPAHPLTYLLPQQCYRIELIDQWMTRIVDVQDAVAQRGFGQGVGGSVHMDLADDILPGNAGKWILTVENGEGRLERGGLGDVKLHARQLASIYTGHMTPVQLAQLGLVDGPAGDIETLAAIFAGPAPWMSDSF